MADRYQRLRHIQTLDPATDFQEIYRQMVQFEFPQEFELAFYLAFIRPFAVPAVSRVTAHTGEITERTRKRTTDTAVLMYTLYEYGFDDQEFGREALRTLNQIHRPWRATSPNDDFLYVLATLVVPPTRFINRYGWRRMCCHEQESAYRWYRELGRRMAVHDFPDSYAGLATWFDKYEEKNLAYDPANKTLMDAMQRFTGERAPWPLGWLMNEGLASLLDPPVREAIGLGKPNMVVKQATDRLLRLVALRTRISPPRREPAFVFGAPFGFYTEPYTMDDIGPSDEQQAVTPDAENPSA